MRYNIGVRKRPEVSPWTKDNGSNYITIEDEDGSEFELEQISTLEYRARNTACSSPRIWTRTTRITGTSSSA